MAAKKRARQGMVRGAQVSVDPELAGSGREERGGTPLERPAAGRHSHDDAAAEKAREEAFLSEYEWNGKPLTALTSGRWTLILAQRAQTVTTTFLETLTSGAFFSEAMRILYFCATEPADWRPFRMDPIGWQEEIERWGDENVPMTRQLEAESLALRIFNDANENRHTVAPSEKGDAGTGN